MRVAPANQVEDMVARFLENRLGFRQFHTEFIDLFVRREAELPRADWVRWNGVYGWVCQAIPDPVDPAHRPHGVIGEEELRTRLRGLSPA